MSADAREFTSPNIEARDYYTRLGVPEGAEAEVIERNVKKHVRDFMPQVSDHERAEERWERFNQARRTLKDPDEKEQYDTFRERFGPERGTEAFEKWEARGRRKDPAKLDPVRDLGLPAGKEPDEASDGATDTHHQQRSETDSTTEPRFRQQRQTEQSRQRREYEIDIDIDIDLDSTKTHSTRSPEGEPSEETTDEAGGRTLLGRVVDHASTMTAIAIREVTAAFSIMEFVVAAYIVYRVVVERAAPVMASAVGGTLLIDTVTAGTTLGLGYLLVSQYLERFAGEGDPDSPTAPLGRRIFQMIDNPAMTLVVPGVLTVLLGVSFLFGGGGGTLFLLGLALLSLYARFKLISDYMSLPEWEQYAEPLGAVAVSVLFLTVFIATDSSIDVSAVVSSSDAPIAAVIVITTLVAIVSPIAPVVAAREE